MKPLDEMRREAAVFLARLLRNHGGDIDEAMAAIGVTLAEDRYSFSRAVGALDSILGDAATTPEEKIARIRALYERPGTEGEKQAAAAALRRLGADPDRPEPSSYSYRPPPQQNVRWHIEIGLASTRRVVFSFNIGGNLSEADARARALAKAEKDWRDYSDKPTPKFVVLSVRRA